MTQLCDRLAEEYVALKHRQACGHQTEDDERIMWFAYVSAWDAAVALVAGPLKDALEFLALREEDDASIHCMDPFILASGVITMINVAREALEKYKEMK